MDGRALFGPLLPVWIRRLADARMEADRAVSELAARFAVIVKRLDAALEQSRAAAAEVQGREGATAIVEDSRAELAGIVASLESSERSKEEILSNMSGYAGDLREMVAEVRQLGMHITLLSMNATIEAARAGEAGRAFAVVVQEMRRLSTQASDTGSRMTQRVDAIAASIQGMSDEARRETVAGSSSIGRAEVTIDEVLGRFDALTARLSRIAEGIRTESDAVRGDVAEALVALQFQDRVSQVVSHVLDDMGEMHGALEGEAAAKTGHEWLQTMTRRFSTPEEFASLDGRTIGVQGRGEVTLFQ